MLKKELKQRLCWTMSVILGIVCIGFQLPREKVKPQQKVKKVRYK